MCTMQQHHASRVGPYTLYPAALKVRQVESVCVLGFAQRELLLAVTQAVMSCMHAVDALSCKRWRALHPCSWADVRR